MEDDTMRVKIARVLDIIQRLAPGHNALFLALNVGIFGSPDQVLRRFFKATLLPMFDRQLQDYANLMRIMRMKVWELQHDSVQGLTSTTKLALCIRDLGSRTDVSGSFAFRFAPLVIQLADQNDRRHAMSALDMARPDWVSRTRHGQSIRTMSSSKSSGHRKHVVCWNQNMHREERQPGNQAIDIVT
jgi:hypothetical protein